MKAQVFRGVNQLSYEDVPVPELADDEVLVQVRVVGLCQSWGCVSQILRKSAIPCTSRPEFLGMKRRG